jgi:hypothetical protein
MGENLCEISIQQEITILKSKELKQLKAKITNNTIDKWTIELNRYLSKEEVQMANKYLKKMFKILSQHGNAN